MLSLTGFALPLLHGVASWLLRFAPGCSAPVLCGLSAVVALLWWLCSGGPALFGLVGFCFVVTSLRAGLLGSSSVVGSLLWWLCSGGSALVALLSSVWWGFASWLLRFCVGLLSSSSVVGSAVVVAQSVCDGSRWVCSPLFDWGETQILCYRRQRS